MTALQPAPPLRPTTFHVCLFGILCLGGAELGHFLSIPALPPEQPYWPIWPASGLVLGALLVCDRRSWLALAAAAFVGSLLSDLVVHGDSVWVAAADGFTNTIEPLLAAWILRRCVSERLSLLNFEHLLFLVLIGALVAPAFAAAPAAWSAVRLDGAPSYRDAFVRWWIGDGIGVLMVAPIIIACWGGDASPRIRRRGWSYFVELALFGGFLVVIGTIAFSGSDGLRPATRFPFFILTPLLLWTGFRFEPRGAAACIFLLGMTIAWRTAHAEGVIAQYRTATEQGLLLQALLAQATCLALLFSSSIERREISEVRLREESAALAQAEGRMRQQRDLLQSILDSMGEAVIVADLGGRFVLRNPAADKLQVTERATLSLEDTSENWTVLEADGVTPCPVERWPLTRALGGEDCDGVHVAVQSKRGGEVRDLRVTGRPIRAADGTISGAVVVFGDITPLRQAEREQMKLIAQLQRALQEIKTLRGLIPICAHCKKIRNDTGAWERFEAYVSAHTGAEFTHGFCPECSAALYGELQWSTPNAPPRPQAVPDVRLEA